MKNSNNEPKPALPVKVTRDVGTLRTSSDLARLMLAIDADAKLAQAEVDCSLRGKITRMRTDVRGR